MIAVFICDDGKAPRPSEGLLWSILWRLLVKMAMAMTFLLFETSAVRSQDVNTKYPELRYLCESIDHYRTTFGRGRNFPAVILDENDMPLFSWRVALLPYIHANSFSSYYDFSVPWNAKENFALRDGTLRIDKIEGGFIRPADVRKVFCYVAPSGEIEFTTRFFMLIEDSFEVRPIFKNYAIRNDKSCRFKVLIQPKELPITIVEVSASKVHWMEPKDIAVSDKFGKMLSLKEVQDSIVASAVGAPDGTVTCYDKEQTLIRLLKSNSPKHR